MIRNHLVSVDSVIFVFISNHAANLYTIAEFPQTNQIQIHRLIREIRRKRKRFMIE